MAVHYEWDVEAQAARDTVQFEAGEVLEHWHCATYADAVRIAARDPAPDVAHKIVLVRDADDCRAWAYMENGKLPEYFEDAYGQPHAKVPKRFHVEVAREAAEPTSAAVNPGFCCALCGAGFDFGCSCPDW